MPEREGGGTPPPDRRDRGRRAPANRFETRFRRNDLLTTVAARLQEPVDRQALLSAAGPVIGNQYDVQTVTARLAALHVTETVRQMAETSGGSINPDPIPEGTVTANGKYRFEKDRYGRTIAVEVATDKVRAEYDAVFSVGGQLVVARAAVRTTPSEGDPGKLRSTLKARFGRKSIDALYEPLRDLYGQETQFGALGVATADFNPVMKGSAAKIFERNRGVVAVLPETSSTFAEMAEEYVASLNDLANVRRNGTSEATLRRLGVELVTSPLLETIAQRMRSVIPRRSELFAQVRERLSRISYKTSRRRQDVEDRQVRGFLGEALSQQVLADVSSEFPGEINLRPFENNTRVGDYTVRTEGGSVTVAKDGDEVGELDGLAEIEIDGEKVPLILEVKIQQPGGWDVAGLGRIDHADFSNLRRKINAVKAIYPGLSKVAYMIVSVAEDPSQPEHEEQKFPMKRTFAEHKGYWVDYSVAYGEFDELVAAYRQQYDPPQISEAAVSTSQVNALVDIPPVAPHPDDPGEPLADIDARRRAEIVVFKGKTKGK